MKKPSKGDLSEIERQAVAEIRAMRRQEKTGGVPVPFESHAQLIRHLILASHGHAQLRIAPLARELGSEMRTLERSFRREFDESMAECQTTTRLRFAQWLLSIYPPTKIASIASQLGYKQFQDFVRFFKSQTGRTPAAWRRTERERVAQTSKPKPREEQ